MSGAQVIWYLLRTNQPILAIATVASIVADDHLPIGAVMPGILVMKIDAIPYNTIQLNESQKLYTERVQVTPLFKGQNGSPQGAGRKGVNAMLRLIIAACPSQYGTVNGIPVTCIEPLGDGPDLSDEATSLYSGSTDFSVKWIGA